MNSDLIDSFVDYLIQETCQGCKDCEPRLSPEWSPDVVCLHEGYAKWLMDCARRFKAEKEHK